MVILFIIDFDIVLSILGAQNLGPRIKCLCILVSVAKGGLLLNYEN